MADADEGEKNLCGDLVRSASAEHLLQAGDVTPATTSSSHVTRILGRGFSLESFDECNNEADHMNPWDLEDWDSPASVLAHNSSPGGIARIAEENHREIVDAVRAELQVEIDNLVQNAVGQMNSWMSGEIGSLRQTFTDDMDSLRNTIQKSSTKDDAALENTQDDLSHKVEKLRIELNEVTQNIRKIQQCDSSSTTEEQRSSEPRTSDRVMEARMVADERKWRLRLDALQADVGRSLESTELFSGQIASLTERVVENENDAQRGSQSVHNLVSRVTAEETKRLSFHDTLAKLETRFVGLSERVDAQEGQCQGHSQAIQSFSERFNTSEESRREALDEQRQTAKCVEALDKQIVGVIERAAKMEAELHTSIESVHELASDVTEGKDELTSVQARLASQMQQSIKMLHDQAAHQTQNREEILALIRPLQDHATVQTHRFEETCNMIRPLEQKLCQAEGERLAELRVVCGRVDQHDNQFDRFSSHFQTQLESTAESLAKKLSAAVTELGATIDGKVTFDDLAKELVSRDLKVATLSKQFGEFFLLEKGLNKRMQQVGRLAEAFDQSQSRVDFIGEDLRRVRVEVERKLADKIGRAEIDQVRGCLMESVTEGVTEARLELREWVEDARQSHSAIVHSLSQNLDQARTETQDCGLVLRKHEGWMELVFAWMEQVRVREQGLTHIICHMVEEASPDVMKLLEKALQVPQWKRT